MEELKSSMGYERNRLGMADMAERLRAEQLDLLAQLFHVIVFAGLNTLAFLCWIFSGSAWRIGWVLPLCALPIAYAVVLYLGYAWRRRRDTDMTAKLLAEFMRYYVELVLVLGLLWATLLNGLNSVADNDQRSVLYTVTCGVISAAAVLQPVRIAFAFWAPVTLGALLILLQNGRTIDLEIFGLLVGYSPLILFTTLFVNKTMAKRVAHEAKAKDQADVIGLLLRDFEENSSHWLWETNDDLRLRNVSPRFAAIAQMPAHMLNDGSMLDLLHVPTLLSGAAIPGLALQCLRERSAFANLVVPVEVAGQPRWWSLTGRPTYDRSQRFIGFQGVGADVTEATQDARRTTYLASFDSLTELANRAVFQQALTKACASTQETSFAVLYLDLDGFKQVNDTLGHATGDALLFTMAQRIRSCVREGDLAARLGGDEFAILMAGATEHAAKLMAQRVLESVSHTAHLDGHKVEIGVSIGIALSAEGLSAATLLGNADAALYQAKTEGRGTYRLSPCSPAHAPQAGD